ncbi:hypothetical protein HQ945_21790 [Phyllobacterium sp. BT25]|uniref:Uncharacterized protein n=1 Tax=Phyllobacterium pellucidum TaxID=2740464 RepID=A0A849VVW4_9HYPH|nr:hypothetical protein [Phyllobacterium pellucidum]NTS33896.1 hypothetical protein [Phyllobacterium pellucidum]
MATPTVSIIGNRATAQWAGETGTGGAVQLSLFPDKTVQATGTGTVSVQGSRDGTNWFALKNTNNTPAAISLAAASNAADTIRENPPFIRVVVAGGTATITITAIK